MTHLVHPTAFKCKVVFKKKKKKSQHNVKEITDFLNSVFIFIIIWLPACILQFHKKIDFTVINIIIQMVFGHCHR